MSGEDPNQAGLESESDGEPWQPNEQMLLSLLEMGISENAAKRGLYHTDNESVQAAAAYIFEQPSNEVNAPFFPELSEDSDDDGEEHNYKMVFVINAGLGMGVGKIAAQVGHAAINLHRLMLANEKFAEAAEDWEEEGEKKIVLKADTTEDLLSAYAKAIDLGLLAWIVEDAGHTQVPEGSRTVVGVFGEDVIVDQVTGSFKLL
ncbi:probable peptidyl-tRNA hydrolase 2 isoform X2 [Amphibalanus amphitrite]|nr:probable peptidyl-tRNA hydrolase 2 isoform X2 [Amphibalanus amphitrite]XP_043245324.1 probable peptidyl-tRNA hydrolase 2 isoform X2 [Amphibalanus amphitrite]XP_043245325.1 probable peptidyl-tRNA hydrolase 2 isoform X2 [Amphibalanus amphitrite]XP_043245326.1 probable peptidyl-tRNA hydrolase 2 isoform X2 [Amphibalanus amphitrite]